MDLWVLVDVDDEDIVYAVGKYDAMYKLQEVLGTDSNLEPLTEDDLISVLFAAVLH